MRLVKSEPGPRVMRSALAMASRVSGSGLTLGGSSMSSRMTSWLAVMLVSPRTREPLAMRAARVTLSEVTG